MTRSPGAYGSPNGMRVAFWLIVASSGVGLLITISSLVVHGVTGASIFTGTPKNHVPPQSTMATLLTILIATEVVLLIAPVVLGLAVARGSNASRVAISAIAAVGLLVAFGSTTSWWGFLPEALLSVAAVLLWVPSSNRHIKAQRQRVRKRKQEADAIVWRPNS